MPAISRYERDHFLDTFYSSIRPPWITLCEPRRRIKTQVGFCLDTPASDGVSVVGDRTEMRSRRTTTAHFSTRRPTRDLSDFWVLSSTWQSQQPYKLLRVLEGTALSRQRSRVRVSSSPPFFSLTCTTSVHPFVAHSLHIGQAGNRIIDRFSDVRKHFRGFHIVPVGNGLGVAKSPRGGFKIRLSADGGAMESAQRIPLRPGQS